MRRAVIVLLATVAVAVGREPSTAQESPVVTSRVSEWSGPFDVGEYSVPKPKPIDIPYTLSAIYMPKSIWPSFAWGFLRTNNERNAVKRTKGQRMPLLGYYQGDSPEVLDWQIKMAVDRGITNFMFGDYWVDNVDHPVLDTSSKAFLASRYGDYMSFAMLYNFCLTPKDDAAERQACFLNKVLPFYVSQYFTRPNYLKIEGRPVIQFLHVGAATGLSDPAAILGFLQDADDYIAAHSGYAGAYWIANETIGAPTTRAARSASRTWRWPGSTRWRPTMCSRTSGRTSTPGRNSPNSGGTSRSISPTARHPARRTATAPATSTGRLDGPIRARPIRSWTHPSIAMRGPSRPPPPSRRPCRA